MHLSVTVVPEVFTNENGTYATLTVHTDGQSGTTLPITWDSFFGREHIVSVKAPEGSAQKLSAKTVRTRSSKQERKRIEAIGGRAHVGSGAFVGHKSDGSTDRWRMENKFTTTSSYRVTLDDLNKLRSECTYSQSPVFNVDFQDKSTGKTKDSWVLIPSKEFERLVNAVDNTR